MNAPDRTYPLRFKVDYPDRPLNRLTTFFRLFTVIPIGIVLFGIDSGLSTQYFSDSLLDWNREEGWEWVPSGGFGLLFVPILLMLLFRRKYPHWWLRVCAYAFFLTTDQYPPFRLSD